MKIPKKAVKKSAVARKKPKAAPGKADAPKESNNAASSPEESASMLSLANGILEELGQEARLALMEAVEFEADVVQAAVLLRGAGSLKKRGILTNGDELREWQARPKRKIELHTAINVVVQNLDSEIPNLREDLKRGKDIRNQIIHDVGQLVGIAKLWCFVELNVPAPAPVTDIKNHIDRRCTSVIKKMREEMAKPRRLALRVFYLAYRNLSATSDKNIQWPRGRGKNAL